ncbi:Beta-lactamase-like domain-containing protein [Strongyloides ratti]|uniref:Beta-lactamase-like domain-containing protein n=1 Tax=Strongyloides ratti TaxID=34506 RepID=A0A090LMS7_STRRB|nr:Beta-lactamase-like domain-containing protein [Strongyloides ratti]CEF68825.1 Beta-lactamase-like domain-containing protein [Strongyloides ratti]
MPGHPSSTTITTPVEKSPKKISKSFVKSCDDNVKKFNTFKIKQISDNIFCIEENCINFDVKSLIYLIIGDEKACLIDTGFGSDDLNEYIQYLGILKDNMKIIVINTHNHCEVVGSNWRFSTTGRLGLSHNCEDLCASSYNKNYTKIPVDSKYQWNVKLYKITKWLNDNDVILLGNDKKSKNILEIWHTPGHTPDSLIIWYSYGGRFFVGDLFYTYTDILLTYDYSSIKKYVESIRRLSNFIKNYKKPEKLKYSSSKIDIDEKCVPIIKNFQHFLYGVITGSQKCQLVRLNDDHHEGVKFETRDKIISLTLSSKIYRLLKEARTKRNTYTSSVALNSVPAGNLIKKTTRL